MLWAALIMMLQRKLIKSKVTLMLTESVIEAVKFLQDVANRGKLLKKVKGTCDEDVLAVVSMMTKRSSFACADRNHMNETLKLLCDVLTHVTKSTEEDTTISYSNLNVYNQSKADFVMSIITQHPELLVNGYAKTMRHIDREGESAVDAVILTLRDCVIH